MTEPVPVMCGNEDHPRPRPAAFRVSWPDGRFLPGTACRSCLRWMIAAYVIGDEDGGVRHGIHVEDIAAPVSAPVAPGAVPVAGDPAEVPPSLPEPSREASPSSWRERAVAAEAKLAAVRDLIRGRSLIATEHIGAIIGSEEGADHG